MSGPVILLVEPDSQEARRIAEALGRCALPQPVHAPSGEAAVAWVRANPCDVCVLAYQLPGIDGLETLTRLHQRRPGLPVVLVSGANAEQVAVAAFRAGAVDYLAKHPGYPDAVARVVQQVVRGVPAAQLAFPAVAPGGLPEALLQPSYQHRLRVIGRQLDLHGYRAANLLEVGGGFVVRALAPGSRTPEALEFPDRDFPLLVAGAIAARGEGERGRSSSPLLPTGYEDFLRALGHRLDAQAAEAITVTDLDSFVAVGGVARAEGWGHTTVEPLRALLYAEDITQLLDEAFRRRATPEKKGSAFARLLGRSAS